MVFDNTQDKEMTMVVLANHQLSGPYHKVGPVVKVLDALMLKIEQANVCSVPNIEVKKADK